MYQALLNQKYGLRK